MFFRIFLFISPHRGKLKLFHEWWIIKTGAKSSHLKQHFHLEVSSRCCLGVVWLPLPRLLQPNYNSHITSYFCISLSCCHGVLMLHLGKFSPPQGDALKERDRCPRNLKFMFSETCLLTSSDVLDSTIWGFDKKIQSFEGNRCWIGEEKSTYSAKSQYLL